MYKKFTIILADRKIFQDYSRQILPNQSLFLFQDHRCLTYYSHHAAVKLLHFLLFQLFCALFLKLLLLLKQSWIAHLNSLLKPPFELRIKVSSFPQNQTKFFF